MNSGGDDLPDSREDSSFVVHSSSPEVHVSSSIFPHEKSSMAYADDGKQFPDIDDRASETNTSLTFPSSLTRDPLAPSDLVGHGVLDAPRRRGLDQRNQVDLDLLRSFSCSFSPLPRSKKLAMSHFPCNPESSPSNLNSQLPCLARSSTLLGILFQEEKCDDI